MDVTVNASRQVSFALSITKLKIKKKKYINLCDHQNSAIDIVADTGSPVINDVRIFFRSALKIYPFEIIIIKHFPSYS